MDTTTAANTSLSPMIIHSERGKQSRLLLKADRCQIVKQGKMLFLVTDLELGCMLRDYVRERIRHHFDHASMLQADDVWSETIYRDKQCVYFTNVSLVDDFKPESQSYLSVTLILWKKAGSVKTRFIDVHCYNTENEATKKKHVLDNTDIVFDGLNTSI
jgi:hypothetical protein